MTIVSRQLDSPLGRWAHTEWRPPPEHGLGWAVERIWDFDGMAAAPRERVFPNGLVELIFQLDDRYLDVHGAATVPTPVVCVTGIYSRTFVIQAPRRPCRVLGVRLHPAGAWSLLAHPLYQLADATADLSDLLGRAPGELAGQCHGTGSPIERVRHVMGWLSRELGRRGRRCSDPAVHWVARRLAAGGAVGALRAEVGLSDGRLTALFRRQVGVTPKRYARINRFDRALTLLAREGASLATVAQAAGYYDQPHMNAEFRKLAGLTPREFLRATRFPNSLSLPQPA